MLAASRPGIVCVFCCWVRMAVGQKLKVEVRKPKTKKGRLALKAREPKEVGCVDVFVWMACDGGIHGGVWRRVDPGALLVECGSHAHRP